MGQKGGTCRVHIPIDASHPGTPGEATAKRIIQNEIRGSLELGHERESEFQIRSLRIEHHGVVQLGEGRRNDNELHFNAARTRQGSGRPGSHAGLTFIKSLRVAPAHHVNRIGARSSVRTAHPALMKQLRTGV